jgi:hypothetical protein
MLKFDPNGHFGTLVLVTQCRVTNTRNLLQGDDEVPGAGDTAAVPLRKRVFPKEMVKNQNAGDTTSAQLAANG